MDISYVAGFIDGEGCIAIQRANLTVRANQVRREVLDQIQTMYGGKIYPVKRNKELHPKWNDAWEWIIYNEAAFAVLEDITPYLIVKQQEAEYAMKFWEKPDRVENQVLYKNELQALRKAA